MKHQERCVSCQLATDRFELVYTTDDPDVESAVCVPCLGGNVWSEPVEGGSVVEWRYKVGESYYTVLVCLRSLAVSWSTDRSLVVFYLLNMGDWIDAPSWQGSPIRGEAMDGLLERWKAYKGWRPRDVPASASLVLDKAIGRLDD